MRHPVHLPQAPLPPAPPPLPRSLRILPVPLVVFSVSLVFVALPALYDVTHWREVVAMYQGQLGELTDANDADRALAGGWAFVIALGVTVIATTVATVGTLYGSNVARISLCVLSNPAMVAILVELDVAAFGKPMAGASRDDSFPLWVFGLDLLSLIGLLFAPIGGLAALVLLLLPASRRYCAKRGAHE